MPLYSDLEKRLADALRYKRQNPQSSYRFLEAQFKVGKDTIRRRYCEIQGSRTGRTPNNTRLRPDQDLLLCWYLDYLAKFGIPLTRSRLAGAANHILEISLNEGEEFQPIGKNWPRRWAASHPEFKTIKEKPLEKTRQEAMNAFNVRNWYRQ